jgi:hypothetical protein
MHKQQPNCLQIHKETTKNQMSVLKPKCLHQTWAWVKGNEMIRCHNGCAYLRWKKWQHDVTCSRYDKWNKQ